MTEDVVLRADAEMVDEIDQLVYEQVDSPKRLRLLREMGGPVIAELIVEMTGRAFCRSLAGMR